MIYQGSKAKFAKEIVPILQQIIKKNNISCYIEPFVGGANIIDKIKCDKKIGVDKCYSLIQLHKKAQKNIEDIPQYGNSEWWYEAKDIYRKHKGKPTMEEEMEGWRIGAIQFLGSYVCGGFTRGYAKPIPSKDFYHDALINLTKQSELSGYKEIIFKHDSYENIITQERALIYCDPPYQGVKPYGYAFENKFDYEKYWDWVRKMSKDNIIICSELNFPKDFTVIWEKEAKRKMDMQKKAIAIEKLGTYNKFDNFLYF